MKYGKAIQYLRVGLISFLILLSLCIFIRPSGLSANSGISYYGVFNNTLLPYSLAFLVVSISTWRAAAIMDNDTKIRRLIKLSLQVFAVLLIGLLLTPHTFLSGEHVFIGSTLFALQLVFGIVLVFMVDYNWVNVVLLVATFISGLASLVYLNQNSGYMLQSQIIFQISIWLVIIRVLWYLDLHPSKKLSSN